MAARTGVRISNPVEEGHVEYVPISAHFLGLPGPTKSSASPDRRKKETARSPVKLPQKIEVIKFHECNESGLWSMTPALMLH